MLMTAPTVYPVVSLLLEELAVCIEFRSQRQRFIDVALNQPPELPPVLVSLAGLIQYPPPP